MRARIQAFISLHHLLLVLEIRKKTEDETRFIGHMEKKLRTGQLINSSNSQLLNHNLTHSNMRPMSEFKYLRVVDKKPEKKIRVKKAVKSISREIVEEFDNSTLKYALVRVPEGKTVKGIARGMGKVIKSMKLGNIEVYVTTDDEVALYRK